MGLQVAAAGKIINEFTGLAFAGGEFETDNPAIRFVSAEAWTRDAQGAHITFATAPIGTSSPVEGMRLTSEGILLVGTDTASGSAKLQVSGAISVSGITYAGTLALSATGANVITLLTNGSERVRVTSGGKVSIATTDELSPLTLNGDITLRNVGSGNIYSNAYYDGAFRYAANGYATFVSFTGNSAGDIDFLTAAQNSGGAGATASFTSRVTIKNGGNLLVGTTTDDGASKLQVAGTITVTDPYSGIRWVQAAGGAAFRMDMNSDGKLYFQTTTNGFSAATFLSTAFTSGNTSFGGATDGNYRLDVQSSGSSGTLRVYDQTATTGSTSLVVRAGAGQSTNALTTWQDNAGSTIAYVSSSGLLFSGNAMFGGVTALTDAADTDAIIGKTSGAGAGVFGTAGSLIYRPRKTDSASYGDHIFYTGATPAIRFQITADNKIGFFGVTPVARQTVTADAASILAALQAYGLAV